MLGEDNNDGAVCLSSARAQLSRQKICRVLTVIVNHWLGMKDESNLSQFTMFQHKKIIVKWSIAVLLLSSTMGSSSDVSTIIAMFTLSKSTTIVRSSWIHFACILVAPPWLFMSQAKGLFACHEHSRGGATRMQTKWIKLDLHNCHITTTTPLVTKIQNFVTPTEIVVLWKNSNLVSIGKGLKWWASST